MDNDHLVLAAIALFNAITAIMTLLTHISTKETQKNVTIIEKATNSMKDALVKATGIAAHAAGREEGIALGEVKAATLAEGQKDQRDKDERKL